jgi:hypothetical protein
MKGYVDLPIYDSPQQARELAIKLLKDDEWRKDISLASQKMIEDKCRFERYFKGMEQAITGLDITSSNKEGTFKNLYHRDYKEPVIDGKISIKAVEIDKPNIITKYKYKIWKHLDKNLRKKGIIT